VKRLTHLGHGAAFQQTRPESHRCFRRYDTASLAAFTGRALMIFRAGFALNIVGAFVNGLMPLRCVYRKLDSTILVVKSTENWV
jgi:hypothetical protein